jgi:hypothetical protein
MENTLVQSSLLSGGIHILLGSVTLLVGAVLIRTIDRFILRKVAGAIWIALAIIFTRG